MFRVFWTNHGSGTVEFEDFNDAGDAIEFARSLRDTGTPCDFEEVPPYGRPRWDI